MSDSEAHQDARRTLHIGIAEGNHEQVKSICAEASWLSRESTMNGRKDGRLWLNYAAGKGNAQVVAVMLDHGFNIDVVRLPEYSTPLIIAIGANNDEVVELLLERGANTNIGRPIISSMTSSKEPKRQLKYVKLLVEHGADVNMLYDLYGDADNQFTALDWAQEPEIRDYLIAHGAKTAAQLLGKKSETVSEGEFSFAEEVLGYFELNFGEVQAESLGEIVPMGHPVSLHVVPPEGVRQHVTLFTVGLSSQPMSVPDGFEDYRFAELFIQLPGDWDYRNQKDPRTGWPLEWLLKMAQYPHGNNTWLGGPVTIVANDDPPQPLSPDTEFTSLLLFAEQSFTRSDGETVQLFRLLPLYTEERELEIEQGAPALMRALDRNSVPFVVDMNRPNVAF